MLKKEKKNWSTFANNVYFIFALSYWNLFSRSRSFAINHESRQKRIRETSHIRNNMNASILRICFLINEFEDKEKSCRFWYVIKKKKKKEKKREKYRTRRKKGWMGKHVVNSWVLGSCAEDNSDWSVAAGRLTRLVAFGSSSLPRLAQSHSNRASVRVLCRPLSVVSLFGVCVCAYLWEQLPRESYHVVLFYIFLSFQFTLDWDIQSWRIPNNWTLTKQYGIIRIVSYVTFTFFVLLVYLLLTVGKGVKE